MGGPGGWQAVVVPAPSSGSLFSQLDDVSCSGPGSCTATGGFTVGSESNVRGESAAIIGAAAASVEVPAPNGTVANLFEVDCASGGGCAAVGLTSGLNGTLAATIRGLSVVPQQVVLPAGTNVVGQTSEVAGDSPTTAVAIGYLSGVPGGTGGLLVTGIPR